MPLPSPVSQGKTELVPETRVDPDLWELFTAEITLEPYVGEDKHLNPIYGPGVTLRARPSEADVAVRGVGTIEQLSTGRVHVLTTRYIDIRDRLTLPNGTQPPILQVDLHYDENGPYFSTLYTGIVGFRQTTTSA